MKSLTKYLREYCKYQEDIMLVYHPRKDSNWRDRAFFGQEGYDFHKKYNHRGVLDCEVVIEYDYDDVETNLRITKGIEKILGRRGIEYSLWHSGNKSYHIHIFIEIPEDVDTTLYKRKWVEEVINGYPIPDMQVLTKNHLIRAEFGVHEKTQRLKRKIRETSRYPMKAPINQDIYEEIKNYNFEPQDIDNSDLIKRPSIQMMLEPHQFKKYKDGRDRALFILIHTLKEHKPKEEVVSYLQTWYKEAGGYKMNDNDIRDRVDYHWGKDYHLHRFINDLLRDIGATKYVYET